MEYFYNISPLFQALIATCFTLIMTSLGSGIVLLRRNPSQKLLDTSLGFAAGVMIAASYWSLLSPALELCKNRDIPDWVIPAIGFLSGAIFLRIIDKILPHLHIGFPKEKAEGIKTNWKRTTLLILAITIHNFPEGLAVGVAFGAAGTHIEGTSLSGAIALTIGIGIQNFPEGMSISFPLRRGGLSPLKSFIFGTVSAIVEPLGGIIGAAIVTLSHPILPYALSFAAGAMIFVVIEEVIPESQATRNADLGTMGAIIGFCLMMILDVALS